MASTINKASTTVEDVFTSLTTPTASTFISTSATSTTLAPHDAISSTKEPDVTVDLTSPIFTTTSEFVPSTSTVEILPDTSSTSWAHSSTETKPFTSTTSTSTHSTSPPHRPTSPTTCTETTTHESTTSDLGSTTTTPGKNPPIIEPCNRCSDIVPKPLTQTGQYNGMIVLDNFDADNNCRRVDIDCRPGLSNQNATLIYNDNKVIATGVGSHQLSLQCQTDGTWKYQGNQLTSISCLVQENNGPPPTVGPGQPTTAPPTPTTLTPGTDPCSICARMRVDSVDSAEFKDGFITLNNGNVGACRVVQLKCQGDDPTDTMVLMMRGTEMSSGVGTTTINLTCSEMSMWTIDTGIVVPHVMCGIRQEVSTTTTTTLVPTTTTVTTTTGAAASKCNACDNLQAIQVPSLGANEQNGFLMIEHSYEGNNCRVAVVRCKGDPTDNMTILFNGVTPTPATPLQISSSLTCSSDAKWMRLGQQITSVACKATKLPSTGTGTTPTTTTVITPTTTTAPGTLPCSNCNRQFVKSVSQANYKTGFLTLDKYSDENGCTGVYMSCSSPTTGSDVAFVTPTGDQLACDTNRVNMTMTCNSQSQWVTQTNKIVDTISCGVVAGSTMKDPPVTQPGATDCAGSTWEEWRGWSECTKPCGSCGTWQRFRACNKTSPECLCTGTAYQKVPCNLDVCVYPEKTCCDGFTPQSQEGKFSCLPNTTATNRLRL